jgi:hypothetical protein
MRTLLLAAAMVLVSGSSGLVLAQTYDRARQVDVAGRQFTLIPAEVVKRLGIARGPRPDAAAPIIGSYWDCRDVEIDSPFAEGIVFESCGLKIVFCEEDGACWSAD